MEKEGFGLEVLGSIMRKNIRFNPRPWKDNEEITSKKFSSKQKSFIEIHADVVKRVDSLIAKNEKSIRFERISPTVAKKSALNSEKMLNGIEKRIWRR